MSSKHMNFSSRNIKIISNSTHRLSPAWIQVKYGYKIFEPMAKTSMKTFSYLHFTHFNRPGLGLDMVEVLDIFTESSYNNLFIIIIIIIIYFIFSRYSLSRQSEVKYNVFKRKKKFELGLNLIDEKLNNKNEYLDETHFSLFYF